MPMTGLKSTTAADEDMTAFKRRVHAQIKAELEPTVLNAKNQMIQKLKQTRDDKTRQQLLKEYNDALAFVESTGVQRLSDEVSEERIRRSADGLAAGTDVRAQSRMGGFVGEGTEFGEWDTQRPASTMDHIRGKSSLGNKASLLSGTRPGSAAAMYTNSTSRPSTGTGRPSHPFVEDARSSVDEARARKFAEEQARLERAHTPGVFSAFPVGSYLKLFQPTPMPTIVMP
ncbi:hypothetical protein C8F01DRAFT_285204 [Mycena amicta]|nr:hypothetical protein C8F01DRAFT_285204 [Mycena amicta]